MTLPPGAIFYAFSIVAIIWLGAGLAIWGFRSTWFARIAISVSAGVLLGVALIHMMPEAYERLGPSHAGLFILLGYFSIFLLERFVMVHPCDEGGCDYHTLGLAALAGFSLHSFLGGVALGSAILVPGLAGAVFMATAIHKGPEAFSLTSLLVLGKQSRSRLYGLISCFSLMVPLGIIVAVFELPTLGERMIGIAVALSSGTFLHLATGDLLPGTHSREGGRVEAILGFALGIGFTLLAKWLEG
ncbi:MAG: ZIP family metal transporter [Pseudomonadota bacterium]